MTVSATVKLTVGTAGLLTDIAMKGFADFNLETLGADPIEQLPDLGVSVSMIATTLSSVWKGIGMVGAFIFVHPIESAASRKRRTASFVSG